MNASGVPGLAVVIALSSACGGAGQVIPRQVAFLHPPLGPFSFRGRDRDVTADMIRDPSSSRVAGPAFFQRNDDALVGTWVVGMRRGGSRRVRGRYAGLLDGIELLDFCYPTVRVSSRLRWTPQDGSGSPVTIQPAVSISGCGVGS